MNSNAPQIGFDRFIKLDWIDAAIKYRAGFAGMEELNNLLDASKLGVVARKKTRTVLNRLWLEPRPELVDFANRGIKIYEADPGVSVTALTWGMAIATYPFFGKVAELVGRLSALQGDCTSAEVHRRMSEIYGEREGTYRMTNMVLQSQANWGAIERVEKGKRLLRLAPSTLSNEQLIVWLTEAAIRYTGKAVSVTNLQSIAVLFPFVFGQPLTYFIVNYPTLELRSEGPNNQIVCLSQANF
ncbi:conserved hypothetical protein [Candidatus Methylobacter favarea]|uniref:Uncharacterized protein n=1 Tax=Candidatus Methylobacter favarea TaxID=2707345 RepID=A0A8S0X325_9GAMM|nr:hypothetical protein [Candidatus Methylobacter favarea]CAA9892384.1 conserved hypothetical protein [Candidatus Methylobacter favarea]